MKIPINIPLVGKEEIEAVIRVLKEGALTTAAKYGGKNVQEFEKLTASFTKSKYVVAVNSGTSALQAALLALDVKQGDEVLIPSFSFVATANAVLSTKAKPVFVDILKKNYTIDPDDLRKKITKKSKAIIPVHLYGNVAFIDQISEIAKKHNVHVIEDAAQSLGSTLRNKHTGTFSELGCYSLYPAKVMTSGEGGLITTNNKKLHEKLLMIRNHGMVDGYDTRIFGLNLRLPEISAAIAKIQIKKLPKFLFQRKKNATILSDLISDLSIKIPKERKGEKVNWYLYTIAIKNRNKIMEKLNKKGICAAAYYFTPIHKTPFYKTKIKLQNTDWAASSVLSIPIHPKVSIKNLHFIAKNLRQLYHEFA
ncbi:MAG TPA: DegT/DnrJ/EryC1/StrS family aminotransferase [Nitrosopumilaceae archaeon]|nr:DegT/DnrJ/EryC1/StrS family aminotransferase [Nitrosopumilaceae archaeon]